MKGNWKHEGWGQQMFHFSSPRVLSDKLKGSEHTQMAQSPPRLLISIFLNSSQLWNKSRGMKYVRFFMSTIAIEASDESHRTQEMKDRSPFCSQHFPSPVSFFALFTKYTKERQRKKEKQHHPILRGRRHAYYQLSQTSE